MHADYLTAIRNFEGFTQKASWDYAQFSNGYGTKARFAGEVIDEAEARRRFDSEVASARSIVEKHAAHVDEGTKAALTSLTYNAGDAWTRSGLGDAVRAGDLDAARSLFVQYNKAGGETLPGLVNRRLAEVAWFGAEAGESQGSGMARNGSRLDGVSSIPSRVAAERHVATAMTGIWSFGTKDPRIAAPKGSDSQNAPANASSDVASKPDDTASISSASDVTRALSATASAQLATDLLLSQRPTNDEDATTRDRRISDVEHA